MLAMFSASHRQGHVLQQNRVARKSKRVDVNGLFFTIGHEHHAYGLPLPQLKISKFQVSLFKFPLGLNIYTFLRNESNFSG